MREPVVGAISGRRTGKPGGGDLGVGVPRPAIGVIGGDGWERACGGVGAGKEPASPGVPAGKGKTGRGSSLVRNQALVEEVRVGEGRKEMLFHRKQHAER